MDRELYNLFKFVQGICHTWDAHEAGLLKREHKLHELLHECRREHDSDNQKREEKLDQILDQMRESSSEKDLKRLLSNVALQLDAIKRGYQTFRDAQLEIVKLYPDMVADELDRYANAVQKFFLLKLSGDGEASGGGGGGQANGSELGLGLIGSIKQVLTERLSSEGESKTGGENKTAINLNTTGEINMNSNSNAEEIIESILEAQSSGFKPDLIERVQTLAYLKNCFIQPNVFEEIKKLLVLLLLL